MNKQEEEKILEFWEKEKIYEKVKDKNKKGKNFYFLQGPPYTSGRLHIGHAWNNAMKDIVLRYKRMRGFNVWDRAGYDMHGLPTENAVQKKLEIKDKLGIEEYGVEKFVLECKKFSSENALIMDKDLARLGIWMDFKNAYWPIKNEFIEGEWWLIKKAWEQKRLYKGKKIMQWCGNCETSLAKHELEYETVKENSIFLKFLVKGSKNKYLVVWTTTPWTIPYNLAVMVNPEVDYIEAEVESENGKEVWIVAKNLVSAFIPGLLEKKFKILKEYKGKKLLGVEYEHPFKDEINYKELKKKWPKVHTVILSEEYVDTSSGSGLVHSAPGCGPEDFEVCEKYGIGAFNNIDEKGIFRNMGKFTGLVAKRDDKKFVEALKEKEALIKENEVEHEYAHCWRCHKPVVFRATEQWFLKIEDLIPRMLNFNKDVKWVPEFAGKNYNNWVENLKDNGITRQRYWGCPAPIWQCKCGNIEVIENKAELEKKMLVQGNLKATDKKIADLHKPWIDEIKIKCSKCKGEMERVKDVIDVWIDSGTASWNCLDYPREKKYFDLWPADFILEATEQIKLWFSMLQICSAIAFGKSCYKNVYCHGMILDYQGMKMSKSLGNIISPYEVIDKYGADVLRYYMSEVAAGENINFNWEDVKQKQRNLLIFWNLHNLLADLKNNKEIGKQGIEEKFILSRLNSTIKKVTEYFEEYKIDKTITEIEKLFLDLSRIYIQYNRERSDEKVVFETLNEVYLACLKMLSVIAPFITESVWQELREKKIVKEESVHLCSFPDYDEKKINKKLEEDFEKAKKIIEAGLAARNEVGIGLKWPLIKAEVTCSGISKEIEEIIMRQLNVKKLDVKKINSIEEKREQISVKLDTKMNPELEAEGYAREVARGIQAARKKSGLVKENFIDLEVVAEKKLAEMLRKHENFLKERTNATKIIISDNAVGKNWKIKEEISIKERKVLIFFTKIE